MANLLSVRNFTPRIGRNCFLAPTATLIGDVILGDQCSVWFNAIIRGDVNSIRLGEKVNVQDGAVLHCTYQRSKTIIGDHVSIGHRAIVHGCRLEDHVLIGMGAVVMDGSVIGSGSIVAAGAVVLENTIVEPGTIYAGVPAKKMKSVSKELKEGEIERIANNYVKYASWY